MLIKTLELDSNHWSTDWIPISYRIDQKNYKKCKTFLWDEDYKVMAICRSYYISPSRIEIGDMWLSKPLRGKYDKEGDKYSIKFMKKVISKIWKLYPKIKKISLIVSKDNSSAIKLYENLLFKKINNISSKHLNIKQVYYMEREKRIL